MKTRIHVMYRERDVTGLWIGSDYISIYGYQHSAREVCAEPPQGRSWVQEGWPSTELSSIFFAE